MTTIRLKYFHFWCFIGKIEFSHVLSPFLKMAPASKLHEFAPNQQSSDYLEEWKCHFSFVCTFQCLVALIVKNIFFISNMNVACYCSFYHSFAVHLLLHVLLLLLVLKTAVRLPPKLFFLRLKTFSSLSLFYMMHYRSQ